MADKNKEDKSEKTDKQKKEELKEKLSKGYLKVHLIFEVVGKPAEFIDETTKKLIEELEKEKLIQKKKINKVTYWKIR